MNSAQLEQLVKMPGVYKQLTDGGVGWAIRVIIRVQACAVTLNDGVSFSSPCFAGAAVGDVWAVHHEGGSACYGKVVEAVRLQAAK